MGESLIFHCPNCGDPIGAIRPYTGKRPGRPPGTVDAMPRKERAGDLNKAVAKAVVDAGH